MAWSLCSSGAAIAKAGDGANATIVVDGSTLADWSDQKEAELGYLCRKDFVAGYSGYATNIKNMISSTTAIMIALEIINYDMSGYTNRNEVQTMLDVLDNNFQRNLKVLQDKGFQEKL